MILFFWVIEIFSPFSLWEWSVDGVVQERWKGRKYTPKRETEKVTEKEQMQI